MSGVQFSSRFNSKFREQVDELLSNLNKLRFQSATRSFISHVEFKVSDLHQKEIINFWELQGPHPKQAIKFCQTRAVWKKMWHFVLGNKNKEKRKETFETMGVLYTTAGLSTDLRNNSFLFWSMVPSHSFCIKLVSWQSLPLVEKCLPGDSWDRECTAEGACVIDSYVEIALMFAFSFLLLPPQPAQTASTGYFLQLYQVCIPSYGTQGQLWKSLIYHVTFTFLFTYR